MISNPESLPQNGAVDPGLIPREPTIEELLGQLVDRGLDPDIAYAYSPGANNLYLYPDMGPKLDDKMTTLKRDTLESVAETHKIVYDLKLLHEESLGESRRVRRNLQHPRSGLRLGRDLIQDYMKEEFGQLWLSDLYSTQDQGLARSDLIHIISANNILYYLFEYESEENLDLAALIEYHPYIEYAFGDEAPEQVSATQLVAQLRAKSAPDLSKEMLDARFENFSAIAQLEAADMFINDLQRLNSLGSARRQALMLAAKYKTTLLADDYEAKVRQSLDLAKELSISAYKEPDQAAKRALKALSHRNSRIAEDLVQMRQNFRTVYEKLGYELPEVIKPPAKPNLSQTKIATTSPNDFVERLSSHNEPDSVIAEELKAQVEQIQTRAEQFAENWRLTAKQRREMGFSHMQHELVMGPKSHTGRQLLPPIGKDDAQRVTDYFNNLYHLYQSGNASRTILKSEFSCQQNLEEECELLSTIASEIKLPIKLPQIEPVQQTIDTFISNWAAFKQLIIMTWPNYEGTAVAERIENAIFDRQPTLDDDQVVQDVMSLQRAMAEQLDRILLPPEATSTDLEKELERVGASQTKVSHIEWQRLADLVELRNQFMGTLFRSKDRSLGNAPPYFVVVFELDDDTFAVAESPVFGNATYIVSESHASGTWLEVLELSKKDARTVGAFRVIHSQKGSKRVSHGSHIEKLYDKIIDLHVTA